MRIFALFVIHAFFMSFLRKQESRGTKNGFPLIKPILPEFSFTYIINVKEIKKDWVEEYKIEPVLIETFVDRERFSGVCYRAANFEYIGETKGRGRQDCKHEHKVSVKGIYLYALCKDFQRLLCGGQVLEREEASVSEDWAEEEFRKARLRDLRLKKRLMKIARDFYANPQGNIPLNKTGA
ncbi:MAG: transposase DNA-binding-containing protein [bacterium]